MIGQQWMYTKLIGSHHTGWLAGNTDWLVHVVSFICASVLILLLIIYGYILCLKYKSKRREKVKTTLRQELLAEGSFLQQYLNNGEIGVDVLNMTGDQQIVLQQLLLQRLAQGPVEQENLRIRLLSWQVFGSSYRSVLKTGKWSERVNTLLYIEQFHMVELLPKLEDMLRVSSCTPLERFIILRIYARTGYFRIVKELMREQCVWSDSQVLQILLLLTDSSWTRLKDHFKDVPYQVQSNIVHAIRIRDDQTEGALVLLEKLILGEDSLLRTHAYQALAQVGRCREDLLTGLLLVWNESGEERQRSERLTVTRLMGDIHADAFIPRLKVMMGDPSFQIRQEAANSLARYEQGLDELRDTTVNHPDRYARQIAEETLERMQYGRKMD
ncbi:HEAT repeat domain-containing protein [Paenibacillus sp. 1781tsa1]|uniref:HEAT repeat domain-containing protein n=1 Tax=Paenibacillus sp. 1781tsa1 TaxID=2953810 RepID=UPI00209E325C|nr:HEAT repeat domain-containing protein [Paenibacillus sp. 1781tsa1]MCP1181890.1 HEAT repeat domain-containing protein [Paenibacillus sp. 1781tsa1]